MSIKYLLDTSIYSQPIKKKPIDAIIDKWEATGDNLLCSSVICEAEILQGLEMANSNRLWQAYNSIIKNKLPIIDINLDIVKHYARLQAHFKINGNIRPVFDLLIACTAISNSLTLVTCNVKDFEDIGELKIEDWSK